MKILLINTNPGKYINKNDELPFYYKALMKIIFEPPLTLQALHALTPKKYKIKLIDELRCQDTVNFDEECDLVGITSVTCGAPRAYQIADEFRKRGKTVIIGGHHASLAPQDAKQHADSVVIGEAEKTWPQLLQDHENNKLKPFYKNEKMVTTLPLSSLKSDRYKKINPVKEVKHTIGCPQGCEFCTITNIPFKRTHKKRDIDELINELKKMPQKIIVLCDASLTIDKKYSKEFFKKVKKLNKKMIYCNANVDVLSEDEEFVKLGSEAGVLEWHVGFESISQQALKEVDKKTNRVQEFIRAVENVHKYNGIMAAEFIFGFDSDTKEIFDETIKAVGKYGLDYKGRDVVNINILTPFPGTPLYDRMKKQGRILTHDFTKYDYRHVVFQPKNMTPEELKRGYEETKKKLQPPEDYFNKALNELGFSFHYYVDSLVRKIGISPFRKEYYVKSKISFAIISTIILTEMFFTMLRKIKILIKRDLRV